jgi:hypothetical protein
MELGGMDSALEPLRMAKKLDPYRETDRVCLKDGLKLDLNHLARRGFVKFGANIGARGISWSNSHHGEIASGVISEGIAEGEERSRVKGLGLRRAKLGTT